MIIRDGRRVEHDLGPRTTFEPSMMKTIAFEPTGTGGWNRNMGFLFVKPVRSDAAKAETKREYMKDWRRGDLERQRQLERERAARYRERRRAERQ